MKYEPLVKIPLTLTEVYKTGKIGASKRHLDILRKSTQMKPYWPELSKKYLTEHQWLMFLGAVRYAEIKASVSKERYSRRVDVRDEYGSIATKLRSLASLIYATRFDLTIKELMPSRDDRSVGTLESGSDFLGELMIHLTSSGKASAKPLLKRAAYLLNKIGDGKLIVNTYRLMFVEDFSEIYRVPFRPANHPVVWPPKISAVLTRLGNYAEFLSKEAMVEARPDERGSNGNETRVFIWHLAKIMKNEQESYGHGLVAAIANGMGYGGGKITRERVREVIKTFR